MVAGEVESSCQLIVTFFFFFFGLTLPNYRNKCGSAQPPLISTTCSPSAYQCPSLCLIHLHLCFIFIGQLCLPEELASAYQCPSLCLIHLSSLLHLHWPTLHTRRSYFSTSLTHDILHNRVAIPFSKYFQFSTTVTRSHPMSLFIPSSTINSRRFSFFINSPFLWNTIPHRILKLTNPVAFRTALRRFLFA